jgi:hypothetical protein
MSIKTRLERDLKQAQTRNAPQDEIDRIKARAEFDLATSKSFNRFGKSFGLVTQDEWNNAPWIDLQEISKRMRG